MLVTDSLESQLELWLLLTISFAKSVVAGLSRAVRLGGIWINLIPLSQEPLWDLQIYSKESVTWSI